MSIVLAENRHNLLRVWQHFQICILFKLCFRMYLLYTFFSRWKKIIKVYSFLFYCITFSVFPRAEIQFKRTIRASCNHLKFSGDRARKNGDDENTRLYQYIYIYFVFLAFHLKTSYKLRMHKSKYFWTLSRY